MTPFEIIHHIKKLDIDNAVTESCLIITGGEPALQDLDTLISSLNEPGFHFKKVQIETNGILEINVPKSTMVVISPKCVEKNGKEIKYLKPNNHNLQVADVLKFVMSADQNSLYSSIPDWAHDWKRANPGKEIYISPMNIYNEEPQQSMVDNIEKRSVVNEVISFWTPGLFDLDANEKNHNYTAEYCIKHNLVFNLQQHIYAGLA